MTQLDCTATNCLYNKDSLCSKGDITIGGKNATRAGDTCCESFREKGSNTMMNSAGHASASVDIECEATKCVHNENCKCSADHIGIGGGSNACKCQETECADFRCSC